MKPFNTLVEKTTVEQSQLLSNKMIQRCFRKEITKTDYVLFLKQAYHHVKNTVPLLMLCGGLLPEKHNSLRHALSHYIEEEIGHELWILNDLESCGVNKEQVIHESPLSSTDIFVSYIYDMVQRKNPIGLFGMVYVLESTSVLLASDAADNIKSELSLSDNAFSYLYSHGHLDKSHMSFFENTVNQIEDEQDLNCIIDCANTLFKLYGNILSEIDTLNQKNLSGLEQCYEV